VSPLPFIIFLPVRNGGNYIRQAVASIMAQSDPNWQLVVLENQSTDATGDFLAALKDPRIEIVSSDEPLDICDNWHRAWQWLETNDLNEALVTTIGHDDYFDPRFIEVMRRLADVHPSATLYQAAFNLIDSQGTLIRPCKPIPDTETWQGFAAALCWSVRDSYGTGYVFRAGDYRRVGGIPHFPKLLYADHLLFIRLARLGHKRATEELLCSYRLHGGSASSGLTGTTLNAYVEALDRFVEKLRGEMADFVESISGRNALSCLIARQIVSLGNPSVRPLLTQDNKDRIDAFKILFAMLSPEVSLETWAEARGSRSVRHLERLIQAVSLARVRWRERKAS